MTSCESLRAAMSQYFSLWSIPMAGIPNNFAAANVVPLPKNGSITDVAFVFTNNLEMSVSGFGHGWSPVSC